MCPGQRGALSQEEEEGVVARTWSLRGPYAVLTRSLRGPYMVWSQVSLNTTRAVDRLAGLMHSKHRSRGITARWAASMRVSRNFRGLRWYAA
jgi:hypothetical protein